MKDHYHLKAEGALDHALGEDKLESMKSWLADIVKAVNMVILIEPQTIWCDDPNNEGMTGFCCITTSHCSFHAWNGNAEISPFIKMDFYSCRPLDVNTILPYLKKIGIYKVDYTLEDRSDDGHPFVLDQKKGLYL